MSATAIYSVVNSKRERQDGLPQGEDVVYSEIKFPGSLYPQSVSHDGEAGKEKTGSRPHPYRLTVVCLGPLCFFLIICIIVLSINLHRANWKCSVMEGDLQQLSSRNKILTKEKEQIQKESSEIEQNCSSLANDNIQLRENYSALSNYSNHLQENCSITAKQKEKLQKYFKAVLNKSHHLASYCGTSEIETPCRQCPQGWERFSSSCYLISTDWKSWKDSRIECLKSGADLVIIESKEEQDFFKGKVGDYWIGLTYNTQKRDWLWLDSTSLRGFQKQIVSRYWNEVCAVFRTWNTVWQAQSCDREVQWICETRALLQ